MIFVTVVQSGYTDTLDLMGPFKSLEESKKETTDGMTRGYDGDETRFEFFELVDGELKHVDTVLFEDEIYSTDLDVEED